jgi:hypothetical protein
MDKYEIFAITVSLNTGKKILRFLDYDLELRQSAMDKTGGLIPRIFHVSRIPIFALNECPSCPFQHFELAEFQLVVLHPDQLLPYGSTLLRRNSDDSYTPYKASNDKLLRQVDPASILSSDRPNPTAQPFPPFHHDTERIPAEALNVYFVLLNAEIKFQRFAKNIGLDKLHPDMRAIAEQTISIVDLMYSQPVRSEACVAAQVSARSEFSREPCMVISLAYEPS